MTSTPVMVWAKSVVDRGPDPCAERGLVGRDGAAGEGGDPHQLDAAAAARRDVRQHQRVVEHDVPVAHRDPGGRARSVALHPAAQIHGQIRLDDDAAAVAGFVVADRGALDLGRAHREDAATLSRQVAVDVAVPHRQAAGASGVDAPAGGGAVAAGQPQPPRGSVRSETPPVPSRRRIPRHQRRSRPRRNPPMPISVASRVIDRGGHWPAHRLYTVPDPPSRAACRSAEDPTVPRSSAPGVGRRHPVAVEVPQAADVGGSRVGGRIIVGAVVPPGRLAGGRAPQGPRYDRVAVAIAVPRPGSRRRHRRSPGRCHRR